MNTCKLKFYADTPGGDINKQFTYKVKNLTHACDLAAKFIQERGFKIRSAWFNSPSGKSVRFDDLYDLKTWQNSLIKNFDVERKLELAKREIILKNKELQ